MAERDNKMAEMFMLVTGRPLLKVRPEGMLLRCEGSCGCCPVARDLATEVQRLVHDVHSR